MSETGLDLFLDIILDRGPVFWLVWWVFWNQWAEIAWLNVWENPLVWQAVEVFDNCG